MKLACAVYLPYYCSSMRQSALSSKGYPEKNMTKTLCLNLAMRLSGLTLDSSTHSNKNATQKYEKEICTHWNSCNLCWSSILHKAVFTDVALVEFFIRMVAFERSWTQEVKMKTNFFCSSLNANCMVWSVSCISCQA